jgi:hypothetical protein
MTRGQVSWPPQSPFHSWKDDPAVGMALSTIWTPSANDALHTLGQSIPAGIDFTVPAPETVTLSTCCVGAVEP